MRLFFQIGVVFFLISGSLFADSPGYSLFFKPSSGTLNYLITYHAETTDVLNISKASGDDQMLKNTSYEYIEAQKDINRTLSGGGAGEAEDSQAVTLETAAKIYFIKKVEKNRAAKSIKPEEKNLKYSAIGRLIFPFNMDDLSVFGLPLFFSRESVKEGDTWEKKFDFTGSELPVLTMFLETTFKKVATLNNRKIAELEYSFRGGLSTTQMTSDPEIVAQIQQMKENNIESVSYEGKGSAAFDFERGTLITDELTLSRRIRKSLIQDEERTTQDFVTTSEFTEALTN